MPTLPFTPGYDIVGNVDAIGDGVTGVASGDRVAALTICGVYAEYIYLNPDQLVRVPIDLPPAEVAPLILNYLVAYQVLHRMAHVKDNDKVLLIGASGGVGTAFLQLSTAALVPVVITGILFLATIIAGGLLSLAKPVIAMSVVHQVGPFLTVASTIVTIYLLTNPRQ